ncbi:MAG: SH3 domain-containing protein [Salaquimonas sp.]|nr:SH3 domain-containing protein [Salaquimonas sp.]
MFGTRILRFALLSFLTMNCGSILAAVPSLAAEPGIYRVSGIAAGDVLNIREQPGADAPIADSLAPGAHRVEVLEVRTVDSTEWGRILDADANGWVAMRFLVPEAVQTIPGTQIPVGLKCGGTEPFWDVKLGTGGIEFSAIAANSISLPVTVATTAIGRNNRFALVASEGNRRMTAVLAKGETCSDGMSDRDYGWRVDLLIEGDAARSYEGCCRLPVAK